ncbi:MAG: peptidase [Rhodobacterales bacterium]|nr:MAG: peptidase [Rhodobacterales bacterium]
MDPILTTIDEALKKKGLSDAAASKLAVGHPALIKNLRMPRTGEKRYNLPALEKLAKVLDLELYFGPPRDLTPAPEVEVDDHRFATIARHDASAAAGGGVINFDAPPVDHLAFSKNWLQQNGIQAGSCSLINATGKSMEPSIWDGDLIMIDHRKTEIRNQRVYVYNDPNDGTRVKRLEVVPGHTIIVRSDNPDQKQFPPEYHTGEAMNTISQNIIGEVVWSGHKWT